MSKTTQSVLDQIKSGKAAQHSRAWFVARWAGIWLAVAVFLFIGVHAWAMIFHFAHNLEIFNLLVSSPRTGLKLIWFGLPLVWLALFGVGLVGAVAFARRSKRGYKIPPFGWVLLLIVPQVVGGYALEQSDMGDRVDARMTRILSKYETPHQRRDALWQNPINGLLLGKVTNVNRDGFTLVDPKGNTWTVTSEAQAPFLQLGKRVRLRGKMLEQGRFTASEVRPDRPAPPRFIKRFRRSRR